MAYLDPILSEIYSTVMPAAPFVIAAYALMWLVLLIALIVSIAKLQKTKNDIKALDLSLKKLEAKQLKE